MNPELQAEIAFHNSRVRLDAVFRRFLLLPQLTFWLVRRILSEKDLNERVRILAKVMDIAIALQVMQDLPTSVVLTAITEARIFELSKLCCCHACPPEVSGTNYAKHR